MTRTTVNFWLDLLLLERQTRLELLRLVRLREAERNCDTTRSGGVECLVASGNGQGYRMDRPAVGQLETADALPVRSGEAARSWARPDNRRPTASNASRDFAAAEGT